MNQIDDFLRHAGGILGMGHAGQHHSKFVAAHAGRRVTVAQAGLQALAHLAQQFIASGMTQLIIHRLEPVQIQP